MSKIYFQGTFGAYSHLAAISIEVNAEVVPCKNFDDCFVDLWCNDGCNNRECSRIVLVISFAVIH